MRRISAVLIFTLVFLGLQASARAQDILVPAGTLLHCTLDEPNFSSATADIGDPVVCHLSSLRQFGQNVFPRGSYLGGHLEEAKEPGRFVGKGSLKLQFDRIGFPTTDIPVPSKVIAAKGYKVDRHGDIVGRGHPRRDIVEWLIPPLWPWKILMLPGRGPRPTLKGEAQVTVRLMDDIQIPRVLAASQSYGRYTTYDRIRPASRPQTYDRAPSSYRQQSADRPPGSRRQPSFEQAQSADNREANVTTASYTASGSSGDQPEISAPASLAGDSTAPAGQTLRIKRIALKQGDVYEVSSYRVDGSSMNFVMPNGGEGSVETADVDWRKTTQLSAQPDVPSEAVRIASSAGPEAF